MPGSLQGFDFTYLWLGLLIVFVIAETATANLVTIWFAVGALAALIVSLFGVPQWGCFAVFILVSAVSLLVTRPLIKKKICPSIVPTNAATVIGSVGIVDEEIDNIHATGDVLINGINWMARSTDESVIQKGQKVIVDRIEGVKVFCHRMTETVTESVSTNE